METVTDFLFLGSKNTADGDCSHEIKRYFFLGRSYDQPRQHIIKQSHYFANKGLSGQSHGFSSSHVWMWELDDKESWRPKDWCFWTVVLEKTLESPLNCKEVQPVHPTGNQSWIFTGRTDAEAGAPILWPPDMKNWLIGKDADAEKDWGQKEKGMREDEMVGWHHWLDGHEFEQAPGVGDEQGRLCCSPWGHKESDTTERLNWTDTTESCAGLLKIDGYCPSPAAATAASTSNYLNVGPRNLHSWQVPRKCQFAGLGGHLEYHCPKSPAHVQKKACKRMFQHCL